MNSFRWMTIYNPATSWFYTDDYQIDREVVAYYQTHGITPASGELHVYPKVFTLPLAIELYLANTEISAGFSISGRGKLEIDWGTTPQPR